MTKGWLLKSSQLEEQLRQSERQRRQLQDEIASMKKAAVAAWAIDRMESAVMRERINDLAVEVMRLTTALSGSDAVSATVIASDGTAAGEANRSGKISGSVLADRMRSLHQRTQRTGEIIATVQ